MLLLIVFDTYNEGSLEYAGADDQVRRWADLADTYHPAISRNRHCLCCCAVPGEYCAILDCSAALGRHAVANGTSFPKEEPRIPITPVSS